MLNASLNKVGLNTCLIIIVNDFYMISTAYYLQGGEAHFRLHSKLSANVNTLCKGV